MEFMKIQKKKASTILLWLFNEFDLCVLPVVTPGVFVYGTLRNEFALTLPEAWKLLSNFAVSS